MRRAKKCSSPTPVGDRRCNVLLGRC